MITEIGSAFAVADTGATLTGIIRNGRERILFDSGLDQRQAKKIDAAIAAPISAVYHTHTHADHIGGSRYFSQKHSCPIFVPAGELSFMRLPELEGAVLFGGLSPNAARKTFMLAEKVDTPRAVPSGPFTAGDTLITPVDTAGHSPDHKSYIINDLMFVGDALFSPEIIDKHRILYLYNPQNAYKSAGKLMELPFDRAVLCHKGVISREECAKYVTAMQNHIETIEHMVFDEADETDAGEITARLSEKLEIKESPELWLLNISTIKGYLSSLEQKGLIELIMKKGICWKKK